MSLDCPPVPQLSSPPATAGAVENLIYDVGMHRGDDTAFYLAKGFRVVGVEANPAFVAHNRHRFASALASGQLRIVHAAVAEQDGSATFWAFPGKDVWGTLDPAHAQRNLGRGLAHEAFTVPCRTFASILEECGIPYFLKIDIEGADLICLRGLAAVAPRPRFVSLELPLANWDEAFTALAQFHLLGYRHFQLVDQALNRGRRCPQPPHEGRYAPVNFNMDMSGLFGLELPPAWLDGEHTCRRLRRLVRAERRFGDDAPWHRIGWLYNAITRCSAQWRTPRAWRRALTTTSWYDLHARL